MARARLANPISRRRSRSPTSTTARWTTRARAAPLARGTGVRRAATGRCSTAAASRTPAPRADADRAALVPRARRHLLLRRRVARRRVPRRDRGLLRAARVRGHATRCATAREHVLAVEVACPPQRDRTAKRTITGGYWQSPVFDRDAQSGRIWRPVRARVVGPGPHRARPRVCASTPRSSAAGSRATSRSTPATNRARRRLHAVVRGPDGERAARRVATR